MRNRLIHNGRSYRLLKVNGKVTKIDEQSIAQAMEKAMVVRRRQLKEREQEVFKDGRIAV